MGLASGRDLITARSFGSTVQSSNIRPQMTRERRPQLVLARRRRLARRQVRVRLAARERDDRHAVAGQRHPRRGADRRRQSIAQLFREGSGTNRTQYFDAYVGDTICKGPRHGRSWRPLRPPGRPRAAERDRGQPGVPGPGARARLSPATTRRSPGTTSRRAPGSPTRSTSRARPSRAPATRASPASSIRPASAT